MDKRKIFVTKAGLDELKREYEDLTKLKRPAVVDRVAQARAMGDLAENSEYTAAREELSLIDGRIEELGEIIKNSSIIEESHSHTKVVQLGSTVTVKAGAKNEMFTLVGEWEADPHNKRISHASPLGQALIGKISGEKVEVEAPVGKILYTILDVN